MALSLLGLLTGLGFTLIPPTIEQFKALVKQAPEFVRTARGTRLFLTLDAAMDEARPERRQRYQQVLHKIYQSIGGYLGGLALICTINATLTTSFLAIARVPFFLPLGILSGLSSMIPYAGPLVTGVFISLLALVTIGVWPALACGIYFILYGQLEGNVLGPLVFRKTVHVNPLVVTLSILFLGEMGIMGAIAAVPVVAVLQIVLREVLHVRREQLQLENLYERAPTL